MASEMASCLFVLTKTKESLVGFLLSVSLISLALIFVLVPVHETQRSRHSLQCLWSVIAVNELSQQSLGLHWNDWQATIIKTMDYQVSHGKFFFPWTEANPACEKATAHTEGKRDPLSFRVSALSGLRRTTRTVAHSHRMKLQLCGQKRLLFCGR